MMNKQAGILAVEPPRESQVGGELTRLKALSEQLHQAVGQLRGRLSSVLRQSDAKPGNPTTPHEILVPLAEELSNLGDGIGSGIEGIHDITAEIELP